MHTPQCVLGYIGQLAVACHPRIDLDRHGSTHPAPLRHHLLQERDIVTCFTWLHPQFQSS